MAELQNLFLVADTERPHSPAFERVRALALTCQARVHIAAFSYHRAIAAVAIASRAAMEKARDGYVARDGNVVEQQAVYLRGLGVKASCSAVWAHPVLPEILLQAAEQNSGLLMKDRCREPLLKRLATASLDQQLLRRSPLPVMLVAEDDRPMPRRILVAADVVEGGDSLNAVLLRHALGLALACNAELHLAYVSEPLGSLGSEVLLNLAENEMLKAEILGNRADAFRRYTQVAQIPEGRHHYLEGPAASTLCDFAADRQFDVIVLANANRSRLDRWLMGSTAEQLVDQAPCSLLSVPVELAG